MSNHLKDIDDQYGDYDNAVLIACKKFDEIHPREKQPEWLKYCMAIRGTRNENKNWVIKMILVPKPELEPNQYREWSDDGVPRYVEINPTTGEKSYLICIGPAVEVEVFFEVEADLEKGLAVVLADMNLAQLDGTKYETNRR